MMKKKLAFDDVPTLRKLINKDIQLRIKNDVIKISQKIAIDSDITIIFDASNYVIAVKAIDLTEKIIEILNTNPNELNIE